MAFKSEKQRKGFFARMYTNVKHIPQKYEQYQERRETAQGHKIEHETAEIEQKISKEETHVNKMLELERKKIQLQKEIAQLKQLKHERFAMSGTGKFVSAVGRGARATGSAIRTGAVAGVHKLQEYNRPVRRYHTKRALYSQHHYRKVRKHRRETDSEILIGNG